MSSLASSSLAHANERSVAADHVAAQRRTIAQHLMVLQHEFL